jgi:cytochrome c
MKGFVLCCALFVFSATNVMAQATGESPGASLYKEKTCIACHGPNGNKPLLPSYPKIAGQNAAYAEQQMLDIKSGARQNGQAAAMAGVMHLVTEAEIKALATYIEGIGH